MSALRLHTMYLIAFLFVGFLSLLLLGLCRTAANHYSDEHYHLLEELDEASAGYSVASVTLPGEPVTIRSTAKTNNAA
jgi:hypothetical protein